MTAHTTRIAPSPTGDFHLGTARTAYFNWLAARSTGGKFILRIDDTDTNRNDPKSEEVIIESLKWLGLDWDAFYRQSERLRVYSGWADTLVEQGSAIKLLDGAVILKWCGYMPEEWHDTINGTTPITSEIINNQIAGKLVLMKSGDQRGWPTYQFASTVDDYLMDVTWVIRGKDHTTNTAKQVSIWSAMNHAAEQMGQPIRKDPLYTHVSLISLDKKKLSKRDKAASLLTYRDQGILPEALLDFMLRLGWGPSVDDRSTALLPREKAMELFINAGRMHNMDFSNMDLKKLDAFNRKYAARAKRKERENENQHKGPPSD